MSPHFPHFLRRRTKAEPSVVPPSVSALAFEALAYRVSKISVVIAEAYRADNSPVPCWLDDVDLATLPLPPASAPEPGVISAETRRSDEEILLALTERLWPNREYLDITADGEPS